MATPPVPAVAHHAGAGQAAGAEVKDITVTSDGRLASVPFMKTRIWLHAVALVLALAATVMQAVFISNKQKATDFLTDAGVDFVEEYWDVNVDDYSDLRLQAKTFTKQPVLVIAVGAVTLVLAVTLLVTVFFAVVRASLWWSILEVCLVPAVLGLWVAALAVSGKTADVLSNSPYGIVWPKLWVALNSIVLVIEIISVIVWTITLVISIISLVRVARAFKVHRARRAPQPHHAVAGGVVVAPGYPNNQGFYAA